MAISISVLILVIGLISLLTLPVEQYPDIAPPTVYVSAQYTGADAEAVDRKSTRLNSSHWNKSRMPSSA